MGEPAIPTVSDVTNWKLDTVEQQGTYWTQQAGKLKTELDGFYNTVGNSLDYLVGKFGNGLRDKGLTVRDTGYKTVGALEGAGTAIAIGAPGMRFAQQTVTQLLTTITSSGYLWGEDGSVTLSLSQLANAMSDKDNAAVKLAALQRQADQYATSMKAALHTAGVAAQGVADGVHNAFSELPQTIDLKGTGPGTGTDPATAEAVGRDDGELVADGKATDIDLQRIANQLASAGITPADVAKINSGEVVQLTEAQWNYLHAFYNTAGLDGLTKMTDRLVQNGDTVSAATVVNQLNTLANPSVTSAGTQPLSRMLPGAEEHPRGGLDQLPSDLRSALTADYELESNPHGRSMLGEPTYNLQAENLLQATRLAGLADSGSAPGSQINQALLLQAGTITPQLDGRHINIGGDVPLGSGDDLVQKMIEVGGADKEAVHDVLNRVDLVPGANPDATGPRMLDSFAHHEWPDDGAAVEKMVSWIETDALSEDPAVATRAGETATPIAKYLGEHGSELLHLNGDRSGSLGDVNPHLVQGLGSALSPYIPNMVGVPGEYLDTQGFKMPDEGASTDFAHARHIFAVIDTNTDAAGSFNAKALLVAQQLQGQWVQELLNDPTTAHEGLATNSGNILGLIDGGIADAVAAHKETEIGDAIHSFGDEGAAYDSMKGALSSVVKYVPVVGNFAGPAIDLLNPTVKLDMIGYTYASPDSSYTPFDQSTEYPSARQFYEAAHVLQLNDGPLNHNPRYDYLFDDQGKLKSYDQAVAAVGNAAKLDEILRNIVSVNRGGALTVPLLELSDMVEKGKDAVKK